MAEADPRNLSDAHIAVAVHFMLTQPRRAVVDQISVTQRIPDE